MCSWRRLDCSSPYKRFFARCAFDVFIEKSILALLPSPEQLCICSTWRNSEAVRCWLIFKKPGSDVLDAQYNDLCLPSWSCASSGLEMISNMEGAGLYTSNRRGVRLRGSVAMRVAKIYRRLCSVSSLRHRDTSSLIISSFTTWSRCQRLQHESTA